MAWRAAEHPAVSPPQAEEYHALSCWQPTPACESQFLERLAWLGGAHGLYLSGVGPGTWEPLASSDATVWQALPGVGPQRAEDLMAFFHHPQVQALAERLRGAGIEGF